MRVLNANEINKITGAWVTFKDLGTSFEITLRENSDFFSFMGFTFVPNGCFFDGKEVNPVEFYSGFRVVTDQNKYNEPVFTLFPV